MRGGQKRSKGERSRPSPPTYGCAPVLFYGETTSKPWQQASKQAYPWQPLPPQAREPHVRRRCPLLLMHLFNTKMRKWSLRQISDVDVGSPTPQTRQAGARPPTTSSTIRIHVTTLPREGECGTTLSLRGRPRRPAKPQQKTNDLPTHRPLRYRIFFFLDSHPPCRESGVRGVGSH